MKRWAWTASAAARTRSSEIAEPRRMLEAIVPLNRCTSCSTSAIDARSSSGASSRTSMPSIVRGPSDVVEAREQVHERGLARPVDPHEGQLRRLDGEARRPGPRGARPS
jgi:hypothetical protein